MLDLHARLPKLRTDHERTAVSRQIEHTDAEIDRLVYEFVRALRGGDRVGGGATTYGGKAVRSTERAVRREVASGRREED